MMFAKDDDAREALLEAAARLADSHDGERTRAMLRRYYRHVVTEDLVERRPEDLLGAALSQGDLARHRVAGEANVRVFTPSVEHDGWATGHTVIEIVTDDMPFLVDSVTAELTRQQRAVHLLVHPQLVVRRSADGQLEEILDLDSTQVPKEFGVGVESWLHVEIDRESDASDQAQIESRLRTVLADVRAAVADWVPMTETAKALAASLEDDPPSGIDLGDVDKVTSLLRWLADGQFTFLGYREYVLTAKDTLEAVKGTGLGLLRYDDGPPPTPTLLTGASAAKAREPELLLITKANSRSTVHRPVYFDYLGVKTFDENGVVTGERRFLGLFAASAYTWSVTRIPFLKEKVEAVMEASGFDPRSHNGKDLLGVLENYPRDELFQTSVADLTRIATSVVHLDERRQTRIFLRRDDYGRFMSALVYLPRDRYTTAVRLRIESVLRSVFGGASVDYTTQVSDSTLARLHYVVRVPSGRELPWVDIEELQRSVTEATRSWDEDLSDAARSEFGEERGGEVVHAYSRAFPESYKEDFHPRVAVSDLRHLDVLGETGALELNLYTHPGEPPTERRLKIYRDDRLSLSHILPIFTALGLEVTDERPYELKRADGSHLHIYDFGLRAPSEQTWSVDPEETRTRVHDVLRAVWSGDAETDGYNALVLTAALSWREVTILRAIARYLRQTGITFSNSYVESALVAHPHIARLIVDLFRTRFDPDGPHGDQLSEQRAEDQVAIVTKIESALDEVASLDQDRIIRSFLTVVLAADRTNYFQRARGGDDTSYRPTLALKLDPRRIPSLPKPRPAHEVWVYSPRVEGVHLRYGSVARGGLRWSDRPEDFRTEVLGLVKAQSVKNTVIVPTGAKGGFFAKQLPDPAVDREAWLEEGKAAYRLYIASLLDLTDNLIAGEVVPPERVVRHDGDDTYLVVAADKGTATFSDLANAVAQEYGFWLDDAFAAGGSTGYDHKGMGITAKGAWESVKRHFRELGHDTQSEDFTVVGVGDMSGDVFGNGMLCSEHIRLVAAFDHRHVFVDPHPDAATSYAERARLFALPRSSWEDYDAALISEGGGVFPRTAKSVTVTDQMREALGIDDSVSALTPADLIRAILTAPVDLLWNGGIGTYVKASSETNADVGDRANDAVRVDGQDLRVKVVGEGGNLGVSQLGRIEAAQAGVAVNTDALDNSAGVDTSDHEVNLKILLGALVRDGDLTVKQRNSLLKSMTDDVGAAVLRDNYEQNVLIGNARRQNLVMAPVHQRFMAHLEARGTLDRALEFLPDDATMSARIAEGRGLTSPELAVLLAYAKIALKADLQDGDLPEDAYSVALLDGYFPDAVRERYPEAVATHPLRRELVVTEVVNALVNRGGITFVHRAVEETGATPTNVARAFLIAREVFSMEDVLGRIESLDTAVAAEVQSRMHLEVRRLVERAARWFLHLRPAHLDVTAEIDRFAGPVRELTAQFPDLVGERLGAEARQVAAEWEGYGVPADLALRVASLIDEFCLLDIVELATAHDEPTSRADIAKLYYLILEEVGVDRMLEHVVALPREDRWDALARAALRDDLYSVTEDLTRVVLDATDAEATPQERLAAWRERHAELLVRGRNALEGLRTDEHPGLAPLSVVLRTLRSLVRAGDAAR